MMDGVSTQVLPAVCASTSLMHGTCACKWSRASSKAWRAAIERSVAKQYLTRPPTQGLPARPPEWPNEANSLITAGSSTEVWFGTTMSPCANKRPSLVLLRSCGLSKPPLLLPPSPTAAVCWGANSQAVSRSRSVTVKTAPPRKASARLAAFSTSRMPSKTTGPDLPRITSSPVSAASSAENDSTPAWRWVTASRTTLKSAAAASTHPKRSLTSLSSSSKCSMPATAGCATCCRPRRSANPAKSSKIEPVFHTVLGTPNAACGAAATTSEPAPKESASRRGQLTAPRQAVASPTSGRAETDGVRSSSKLTTTCKSLLCPALQFDGGAASAGSNGSGVKVRSKPNCAGDTEEGSLGEADSLGEMGDAASPQGTVT
mmetsp:Transcript_1478/g.3479  ORF Transcript_1478/g.3479 Transcript_1478/m.3479 type:complete len:374 (+) Transcript_1478:2540-3661(+)